MDKEENKGAQFFPSLLPILETALDLLPCALAVWNRDRTQCVLNQQSIQLTGYLEQDFRNDDVLWIKCIHPEDRRVFLTALEKLQCGELVGACDYRFLPKKGKTQIWLRDMSIPYRGADNGKIVGIISAYTDISDLEPRIGNRYCATFNEVIDGLAHDIRNQLQVIRMGVELMFAQQGSKPELRPILNSIEKSSRQIDQLQEYFLPPVIKFSLEDPAVILEKLIQEFEQDLQNHGVRIRLIRRNALPFLRLDLEKFRAAFKLLIEFSITLLPNGGNLEVETGLQGMAEDQYVEIKVTCSAKSCSRLNEQEISRPYLRVNNRDIELNSLLMKEILRRNEGQVFFKKESDQRALYTILFRVSHADEVWRA